MKKSSLILAVIFGLVSVMAAQAASIEISGLGIPLVEGAKAIQGESGRTKEAHIATYVSDKTLADVIDFYRTFFSENAFLVIGGMEDDGFSASVKKDSGMFSIKIFSQNERVLVQFIW